MRRALSITLLAVTAIVAATPAAAQQPPARTAQASGQSLGLRYLTWPGHNATAPAVPEPATTPARGSAAPVSISNRRPMPALIPHGVAAVPTPDQTVPIRGLTPANAWMSPAAPAAVAPMPSMVTAPATSSAPNPTPAARAAPAVADPMAPRRDALIFRMQGATGTATPAASPPAQTVAPTPAVERPAMTASAAGPSEQGARYYSVHRQNNRQPDPTPLPTTSYVDAIAVDLPASLASQDLAAPPEPPTLVRNAEGRLQAMPDTSIPDQP